MRLHRIQDAMLTYSTCSDCGEALIVTRYGQTAHDDGRCTPRLTRIEWLTQEWLMAIHADDDTEADRIQALIDEQDRRPPRLAEAAGLYASWGWPVFPLLPYGARSWRGTVSDGKHPATRHGFKDATSDADRIYQWWKRHPDHNIGLATGHRFDVIDVDVPKPDQPIPGAIAYSQLLEATYEDGTPMLAACHGQVSTASGGLHLYVLPSGTTRNRAAMAPGLDYRGLGGYVVAPPSRLTTERWRTWAWIFKPSPVITGVVRGA
jgi:hypothetical protein